MPHTVIHKLKALEAMSFPSQIDSDQPYLDRGPAAVTDEAMDLVDGIIDDACRILGPRVAPTQTQLRLMEEAGYRVSFDGPPRGLQVKSAVIHCQKGLIAYW